MKKLLLASMVLLASASVFAEHEITHGDSREENLALKLHHQKPVALNKQEREVKALSTLKFEEVDAYLEKIERKKQQIEAYKKLKKGIYDYELANYVYQYSPTTRSQVILPADIADLRVGRLKTGAYKTQSDLKGKKDSLSIYMSQHDQARHLFGLYRLRILAWLGGKPELHVTIQQAVDREALFPFLEIEILSNSTTVDMLRYFEHRLSAKDMEILKQWVDAHKHHYSKAKVIDILALGSTQNKMAAYKKYKID